ncbi:hypothetical protein HID58_049228 [Brassica napus]|uniref:Uncharacterized protein n=1 Tax=Brassica napus TaxID=3708 RepID=A0ABQ8B4D8_BRANA|nr:hypothetical protein HID58_049228 [Brassica napus]
MTLKACLLSTKPFLLYGYMGAISASLQNPNLIPKISHSSGPLSVTIVEIPKPASVSVEEVPAKSPTKRSSLSDNGGDETDLPTTTSHAAVIGLKHGFKDVVEEIESEVSCKVEQVFTRRIGLQHVIFELEALELVGSINRPRAWPAFRAYGLELTEVLSNLTDWKVNMVTSEANWGAFLISRTVTKEMRLQSYVAQGNPSWLHGLLAEEGTRNSV